MIWNLAITPRKQPKICVKDEGVVEYSTVNRWFKKFLLSCKNLDDQARSFKSKTVDSKAALKAIEANLANSASHSLVWFVNFTILTKASRDAKLCFMFYQNIVKFLTHSRKY